MSVRVSGTDWVQGGWDIPQTVAFAEKLQERGCDAIHISSGGLHPGQQIPVGPSYQVPLARAVKSAVYMPVIAVGLITDFEQAEAIVGTGDADLIASRARSSTIRAGRGMQHRSWVGTFAHRTNIFAPSRGSTTIYLKVNRRWPATASTARLARIFDEHLDARTEVERDF